MAKRIVAVRMGSGAGANRFMHIERVKWVDDDDPSAAHDDSRDHVAAMIRAGNDFYTLENGARVAVHIFAVFGVDYIRTDPDTTPVDNLSSLDPY